MILNHVRQQETSSEEVVAARHTVKELTRIACVPAARSFITELHARLKPICGTIADFDEVGLDGHSTKLDACLINDPAYDRLRVALFLPSMKVASTVAQNIFELCDRRTDGARFEAVGAALTRLVDVEAHSSGPPNNFMEHALDTYLEAVKSDFLPLHR